MNHDAYATLAAGYALGALDGEDQAAFETHLAGGCRECSAALRDAEETLTLLAREAPPAVPPPSVKRSLMARVAAEQSLRAPVAPLPAPARGPRPRWFPWVAGAVAAGLAAFFSAGFVASRYEARLGRMARETAALRERLLAQESALRTELTSANRVVDLLRDPVTRVIPLRGAGPTPEAAGRLVWHAAAGGHLYVTSLPALPADKTYELWTISGSTPRPAGLFTVDARGSGGLRVDPAPEGRPVDVFAVTIEPAGGVPAPTGPIVLASAK
jgi:anti-sigma-K factor RskA